jgi:hypothetical protein
LGNDSAAATAATDLLAAAPHGVNICLYVQAKYQREKEQQHARDVDKLHRQGRLELSAAAQSRRLREASIAMMEKEISRLSKLLAKKHPVSWRLVGGWRETPAGVFGRGIRASVFFLSSFVTCFSPDTALPP